MRQYTVGLQTILKCDNRECQNVVLMNGNALREELTRAFRKSALCIVQIARYETLCTCHL